MIRYALREAKNNFIREKLANLSAIWSLSISILIMGVFFLIGVNLNKVINDLKEKVEIVVFLAEDLSIEEIGSIRKKIFNMGNIEDIIYTSKEEALSDLSKDAEIAHYIKMMGENPLPASFNIKLIDKKMEQLNNIAKRIKFFDGIKEVRYGQEEVKNLNKIIFFIKSIGIGLGIMLGVISLSMIIYTIRLIVSLRQDEIRIMQLVGATAGFIRMPFLLEGLIAGLLGAIFGLGFLFGIYYLLILRFEGILFLPWPIMAGLGGGGILVGFIGSFISIQKYIEV